MEQCPPFIEKELWLRVIEQRDWNLETNSYWKKLHYAVHFKVCSLISNFHKCGVEDRYRILELVDRVTATSLLPERYRTQIGEKMPDIYDVEKDLLFDVKIVKRITEDKLALIRSNVSVVTIPLVFTLRGEYDQACTTYLDQGQLQDIQNFLVTVHSFLTNYQTIDSYYDLISEVPTKSMRISGSWLSRLALQHSDMSLVPQIKGIPTINDVKLPLGSAWRSLNTLPTFTIPTGENPWSAFLISTESAFSIVETGTDQEVTISLFSDDLSYKVLRSNGSFGAQEVNSVLQSIKCFINGNRVRKPLDLDFHGFGIRRKKFVEQLPEKEEWTRAEFPLQERGLPDWIEDELCRLVARTQFRWLELPSIRTYTEIDKDSELVLDQFLENVEGLEVLGQIEKWVTACSKIEQNIHEDRNNITLVPIITRKSLFGEECAQCWGYILIGPHHPKKESDRIPLITLEFILQDFPEKYKKWSFLEITDKGKNRTHYALGKIHSISKHKVFYWANLRKVLLQPLNIFSKAILGHSADEGKLNTTAPIKVKLHHKEGLIDIPISVWIRRILALEFLMAIYCDSQLEGFLSNIRRLHMARHALIIGSKVSCPYGGKPEEKVQECIINNPIVCYLAKTWNDMPVRYF